MKKIPLDHTEGTGTTNAGQLDVRLCITALTTALVEHHPTAARTMRHMAENLLDRCAGTEAEKRASLPLLHDVLHQLSADTPPD